MKNSLLILRVGGGGVKRTHEQIFHMVSCHVILKTWRGHICCVMLWPALTWRGQEWAQHVQGQLLHTCIMHAAGSSLVMELLTDSI